MKTSEGSFNTSLTFTQKKDGGFLVESTGALKDINITQLFASFENFGQGLYYRQTPERNHRLRLYIFCFYE